MQLNITLESRRQGPPVWSYRWRQAGPDGKLVRRRMIVGNLEQFPTEKSVQEEITGVLREIYSRDIRVRATTMTLHQLADHYRLRELRPVETLEILSLFWLTTTRRSRHYRPMPATEKNWILPRWGGYLLSDIKTVEVESWLKTLSDRRVQPTRLPYSSSVRTHEISSSD